MVELSTDQLIEQQFADYDQGPNPTAVTSAAVNIANPAVFAHLRGKLAYASALVGSPTTPIAHDAISQSYRVLSEHLKEVELVTSRLRGEVDRCRNAVQQHFVVKLADVIDTQLSGIIQDDLEIVVGDLTSLTNADSFRVVPESEESLVVRLRGKLRKHSETIIGILRTLQQQYPFKLRVATQADQQPSAFEHASNRRLPTGPGGKPASNSPLWNYLDIKESDS